MSKLQPTKDFFAAPTLSNFNILIGSHTLPSVDIWQPCLTDADASNSLCLNQFPRPVFLNLFWFTAPFLS
jgi:hypothetical protein